MAKQVFQRLLADGREIEAAIEAIARDMRAGPQESDGHRVPQEICIRARCWLRSTLQLQLPSDAFAVAAAGRALLESVVDASLTYHLPNGRDRMRAWEDSATLRSAEGSLRQCAKSKRSPPRAVVDFVRLSARRIQEERKRFWGKRTHPQRWSNNESLEEDIAKVDSFEQQPLYMGSSLSAFAYTFYDRSCGYVHASGLKPMRTMTSETMQTGHVYFRRHTNALTLLCAELCARSVGCGIVSEDKLTRLGDLRRRTDETYGQVEQALREFGF